MISRSACFRYATKLIVAALFLLVPLVGFAGGGQEQQEADTDGSAQSQQGQSRDQDAEASSEDGAQAEAQSPTASGDSEDDETSLQAGDAVALVNGTPITREAFEAAVQRNRRQRESQGQSLGEQQLNQLRNDILDSLVTRELLYQQAEETGVTISEDALNSELDSLKGQFEDDSQYADALAQAGVSEAQLTQDIERNLMIEKLLDQAVDAETQISEQEMKSFYEENPQYFERSERVTARHILISTRGASSEEQVQQAREEAQEARRLLTEEDRSFAAVAKEYSDGSSAEQGGELGTFGKGDMPQAFEKTAFSLDTGEISEVVRTQYGFHVIEVTEKLPAGTAPYEEQKQGIRRYLQRRKEQQAVQSYVQELKDDAEIELKVDF
jgi:peptidyl-prolyl cis-trans isomerase C